MYAGFRQLSPQFVQSLSLYVRFQQRVRFAAHASGATIPPRRTGRANFRRTIRPDAPPHARKCAAGASGRFPMEN